jgi:polyhydroxyalkanoate synthase
MMHPFMSIETDSFFEDLKELNLKLVKGSESLLAIDDVDVGTAPKELVYQDDKMKLYHYKSKKGIKAKDRCQVPVLIVYALVNKQYMLDLQPDRSIVRNLLERGIDLYIIDWGYPSMADRYLSLDDYINVYLNGCVDFIRETSKKDQINLMGVCQGGTFSAIYSAIYPEKIKNLVTLATPTDFSTNDGLLFAWSKHLNVDALVDTYGTIPGEFLNGGFLQMKPFLLNVGKYYGMFDFINDKEKLLNFLRMEKWIFDSPNQAGECFRQFIKDFFQDNKLVKGTLEVGDKKIDLKKVTMPLLNIYAIADHIVPPSSTKPLNDLVGSKDKELYEFKGGHIGVFVGSKSQKELAPSIAKWLHQRDKKKN